jgi:hypothetical protein
LNFAFPKRYELGVMAHTCNPSTWEAEAGLEFKASQKDMKASFASLPNILALTLKRLMNFFKKLFIELSVVVQAYNSNTLEMEAGGSRVGGQPGLYCYKTLFQKKIPKTFY